MHIEVRELQLIYSNLPEIHHCYWLAVINTTNNWIQTECYFRSR